MKTTSLPLIFGLFLLLIAALAGSCIKPPEFPIEPVITYEGVNDTEVYQGSSSAPNDTLTVHFTFTDGDGDLSFPSDSIDVFLTDSRVPQFPVTYRLPNITGEGAANGIEGDIWVNIPNKPFNICCYLGGQACAVSTTQPADTFSFAIQIRDRAGHYSNVIRTETLRVLCQ
jgi:hypothetical protein